MIWKILEYFHRRENWGDPEKMNPNLMFMLDRFRRELPKGLWIKVHCGFDTMGHSENSQHYLGNAVDFHVVGCHILEAESHLHKFLKSNDLFDYVGLGIYPDWNNPGFHIDVRGKYARWGYLAPKEGEKDGKSISYIEALNKMRKENGEQLRVDKFKS